MSAEEVSAFNDNYQDDLGPDLSDFLQALERTKAEDSSKHCKKLDKILRDEQKQQAAEATTKYLQKEISAARNVSQFDSYTIRDLECDINHLQTCLTNKTAMTAVAQHVNISAMLQEALHNSLPDDASSNVISPEITKILDNTNEDLELSSELVKVLNEIDEKKRLVMERRKKLASLQREVKELWMEKESRDLRKDRTEDSPEVAAARDKLRSRESRLQVVIHFVATLVPQVSSGWGLDNKLLQVLRACDMYTRHPAAADWEAMAKLLS